VVKAPHCRGACQDNIQRHILPGWRFT